MYETQHLSLWCGGVGAAEPRWRGPGLGSLGGAARETEEVTARSHVHGLELASLGPGHAGRYSCGRTRLLLAVHGTDLRPDCRVPHLAVCPCPGISAPVMTQSDFTNRSLEAGLGEELELVCGAAAR